MQSEIFINFGFYFKGTSWSLNCTTSLFFAFIICFCIEGPGDLWTAPYQLVRKSKLNLNFIILIWLRTGKLTFDHDQISEYWILFLRRIFSCVYALENVAAELSHPIFLFEYLKRAINKMLNYWFSSKQTNLQFKVSICKFCQTRSFWRAFFVHLDCLSSEDCFQMDGPTTKNITWLFRKWERHD